MVKMKIMEVQWIYDRLIMVVVIVNGFITIVGFSGFMNGYTGVND